MSLPPLPKELAAFADNQARHCALNDMVQSYGQACRAAALEEAAMAAEDGFKYDLNGYQIADKIRSLK